MITNGFATKDATKDTKITMIHKELVTQRHEALSEAAKLLLEDLCVLVRARHASTPPSKASN